MAKKRKNDIPIAPPPKGSTTKEDIVYVKNSKGEIVKKKIPKGKK